VVEIEDNTISQEGNGKIAQLLGIKAVCI